MRIVITGANGFLGHRLLESLERRGHEVIGTDLARSPSNRVHPLDLLDRPAVLAAMSDWRPGLLIHAGAISGAMLAQDNPCLMFDTNVGGTLAVVEAMRSSATPRLIHLSSNAVYRDRDDRGPVDESFPLGSDEPYGASKVAAESVVSTFSAIAGIDTWMLRVSSIYGPGRRTPYLLSELAEAQASGEVMTVTDETTNMRQFVHIDDVVSLVVSAVDKPAGGCVAVNATGGEYLSEAAIARIVATHLPSLKVKVVQDKGMHGDGRKGPLDLTRAGRLLSWHPSISIEDGIAGLFGQGGPGRAPL